MSLCGIPELVEAIVDEIDGIHSLEQLSVAATCFAAPSQRRLFQSIVLTTDPAFFPADVRAGAMRTFTHAFNLFSASPHLVAYVTDLVIVFSRGSNPDCVDSVFDMLHELKNLKITGYSQGPWDEIRPAVRSSFHRMIQAPSIRLLHLEGIDGVPNALLSYAVRKFSQFLTTHVTPYEWPLDPPLRNDSQPEELSPIRHLTVTSTLNPLYLDPAQICNFMRLPDTQSALQHLTRLDLCLAGLGCIHSLNFIRESLFLSKLEHLELMWTYLTYISDPNTLHLPSLPALLTLTLLITDTRNRLFPTTPWDQVLKSALSTINLPANTPALEQLSFVICGGEESEEHETPVPDSSFETQDYAHRLPNLRRVHCCLGKNAPKMSRDRFVAYMDATFPGPCAARILTYDTSHNYEIGD
jgi:hypothetical protein